MPETPELVAPFVLEYSYKRSTGPVLGAFLTGLRAGQLLGSRTADGRVLMPPSEYDPLTGLATTGLTEVPDSGEIRSWTWLPEPAESSLVDGPHGWALIQIDGTAGALLHLISTPQPQALRAGLRVRAVWREQREGSLRDIAYFEPVS